MRISKNKLSTLTKEFKMRYKKLKLIITVILLVWGTISNAQTYESKFQVDRNGYGNLKSTTESATIKLTEESIWIKYDRLNNPMELDYHEKMAEYKHEDSVESIYVFSDAVMNNYGYSFLVINEFFKPQVEEKGTYKITFKIVMIDSQTFHSTGKIEPTRYTIFYSALKQ